MESTIQIQSQLNGQVEFQFVRNTYPLDDKLYCYYTIPVTGICKPEQGDFIGLFQVGWTGLGELKAKKMINVEEFGFNQENGCGHVVFEAYQLPKNTEHFHQFVYIKNGELVRGASKPFLFETTSFVGQPERMIEYVRQQQEIRNQIERIEKEGQRQWTLKTQEPTLKQLIEQLRQNEERISSIKQQFEELKGCQQQQQQQPKRWTQYQQGVQGVQQGVQGVQQGVQGVQQGVQQYNTQQWGVPTVGMTGIQTGIQTGVPTGIPTGIQKYQHQYTTVYGGVSQPIDMPYGQRFPENMQDMQQTLQVLKYGLQDLKQEMPRQTPVYVPINWENVQCSGKNWEQQVYQQVEGKLVEQHRREQENRQREQLMIQAQIKSCQRQLYEQEKREMKQKQFEEQYLQQQVAQFAHKLQSIRYTKEEQTEEQKKHQEYQITRFEGLLRERLNLQNEKRQRITQQMHQKLRECEQKMREHQQTEQQYLSRHHQQLKERLNRFQEQIAREFGVEFNGQYSTIEKRQVKLQQLLRDLELNFVEQQNCEVEPIRQSQKYLQRMIDEIECQVNEIECEQMEKEVYGQVRRGLKGGMIGGYLPKYQQGVFTPKGYYYKQQVQQLEDKIAEFKRQLKVKSTQQTFEKMGLVGQQWCLPLIQKLREFECCLKIEKLELNNITEVNSEMMPIRGVHIERMLQKLCQIINFFECQTETQIFEETKCRFVLNQLRELEYGLNEFQTKYPTFGQFIQTPSWTTVIPQGKGQQQKRQVRELINEVQHIVSMRIKNFTEVLQQFVEMEGQQQPRFSQDEKLWKEIRNLECQLQGIKQFDCETIEHGEFKQLLKEFERKIQNQQPLTGSIFVDECKIVIRQEQLQQHIRELKNFWSQYKKLFSRGQFQQQPEYMQQYRCLIKLIGLVECQLVEFQTKLQYHLSEQKLRVEQQQQYQTILKKQLQLFQQIKNLRNILPYEQQELVNFFIKQRVQQVVQDCERYLPVDMEVYQPIHKQIQRLVQHIKSLEYQQGEEQPTWEVKKVLKHHLNVLRQLCQEVKECKRILKEKINVEGLVKIGQYQPTQYHFLIKQQIKELYQFVQNHIEFIGGQYPEQEMTSQYLNGLTCELGLPTRYVEELNNNGTFEPSNIKELSWNNLVELGLKFNQSRMVEQETIVSELVHRYIQCLNKPTGTDEEFRRKFEQLYVENTKLGHLLRHRVNEVAELRKQFHELQSAKAFLEMKLVQSGRKYENIERPLTTFEKRQFNVEQQQEYEPRISIAVERVTPVQPESEDEEEQIYNKPTIKQNINQIVGELEYQLNKMRMQTEECQKQSWLVRSQSGQEFPTTPKGINYYPEECCYRSVEGSLLARQTPKPYQPKDEIVFNQYQTKINKLAGQQPTYECTQTSFTVCPVCGIALDKDLVQQEFELHVNSHFTD